MDRVWFENHQSLSDSTSGAGRGKLKGTATLGCDGEVSVKAKSANWPLLAACIATLPASAARAQVAHDSWFPGSSSISELEVIPSAYRGRWAPNRAACNDQDGVDRMVVYSNGLDTYESGGRLQRVTQAGQERSIKLKLAYEGEGNFWDTVETWTLDVTGQRLAISVEGQPGSDALIRCS